MPGVDCTIVHTEPYPYFVAEDVLPPAVLRDMRGNWPERSQFQPEIQHSFTCELLKHKIADRQQRLFWKDFVQNYGRAIATAGALRFRPWIATRFGDTAEILMAWIGLMEADPAYAGHGCHTHHYHAPAWVGTLLFYLDADATGYPGTTIHGYNGKTIDDHARMAASTLSWYREPGISEAVTIAYKENRLMGLFDSPISYHSVHAAAPNAVGNRRIFRVHLTVQDAAVRKQYGVAMNDYLKRRKQPSTDPTVIGSLARDIEKIQECSRLMAEQKRAAP